MQVYHGTYASLLAEIVEYGALLCPNDVTVQRILKMKRSGNYEGIIDADEEELERRIWKDWESNKNYAPDPERQAYIYVGPTPQAAYQRVSKYGIILGFDIPEGTANLGLIWRKLPLEYLNSVLYLPGTDISEARKLLEKYNVEFREFLKE